MTNGYQFCMCFPKEWKPVLKRLRNWTGRPLSKLIKAHLMDMINKSQETILVCDSAFRKLEDECMAAGLPPDEPSIPILETWVSLRCFFGYSSPRLMLKLEQLRKEEASDRLAASRDRTV